MDNKRSHYFAASMNRLTLLSPNKSIAKIDMLAAMHMKEQTADTLVGVARVFMDGIKDPRFGANIKKIMAGGVVDRLKIEAAQIVAKNNIIGDCNG